MGLINSNEGPRDEKGNSERESFKNFPGKRKSGESGRKKKTRHNRWVWFDDRLG